MKTSTAIAEAFKGRSKEKITEFIISLESQEGDTTTSSSVSNPMLRQRCSVNTSDPLLEVNKDTILPHCDSPHTNDHRQNFGCDSALGQVDDSHSSQARNMVMKGGALATLLALLATVRSTALRYSPNNEFYCKDVKHIHLSTGHDASSSAIVSFVTSASCLPNDTVEPVGVVVVGLSPTIGQDDEVLVVENQKEDGSQWRSRYNASDWIDEETRQGLYVSDPYHHVTINELTPDTTYYYRCFAVSPAIAQSLLENQQDEEEGQRRRSRILEAEATVVSSFTTAPSPGHTFTDRHGKHIQFAFLGDLGMHNHSIKTIEYLDEHSPSFSAIILAGDIAYTNPYLWHTQWDLFFDALSSTPHSFLRHTFLQVAAGNHEIEQDPDAMDIFKSYEHRFRMPRIKPPILLKPSQKIIKGDVTPPLPYDYGNSYYSFVYGPSHHIVLNPYADIRHDSLQYKWLQHELHYNVDRSVTPWLIVTSHNPIYNTFDKYLDDYQTLIYQKLIEPLLYQYQVNIFVCGHRHTYMRTHPVYEQKKDPRGTVYIIAGTGGHKLKNYLLKDAPHDWVAARSNSTYGYGTLTLLNETHAKWKLVNTGFEDIGRKGKKVPHPIKDFHDKGYIINQYYL